MAWDGDLASTHNPATSTAPPASWGDKINDNFAYLDGKETYTPTLTASSSNPTYTISKAVFRETGDWGYVYVEFVFTTAGTGSYNVSLPSGWTLAGTRQTMTAMFEDVGGSTRHGLIAREGTGNTLAFTRCADDTLFSSTNPTVQASDVLSVGPGVLYLGS